MNSQKPIAYMIHGFVGAGKTTFSRKLAEETGAVRFTDDEWMVRLYGQNPPAEKFGEFYDRISNLIWELAETLIRHGVSVILDFGFWSRSSRDEARARIEAAGGTPVLYYIKCKEELMRARCLKRNSSSPSDSLVIDEHAFDLFKDRFDSLAEDEDFIFIDTD